MSFAPLHVARDMSNGPDHSILVCTTCKGVTEANRLRAALASGVSQRFALRAVDCMAGCDRPVTVGFQGPQKAQYLFGEITTTAEINALVRFSFQYLNHQTGWTSASERPAELYEKTLARLPALKGGAAT